jgi:hypothetical protein
MTFNYDEGYVPPPQNVHYYAMDIVLHAMVMQVIVKAVEYCMGKDRPKDPGPSMLNPVFTPDRVWLPWPAYLRMRQEMAQMKPTEEINLYGPESIDFEDLAVLEVVAYVPEPKFHNKMLLMSTKPVF